MKKTLTVNLGGTIFNIDEDAYRLLDNYLNDLRIHFRKEEGSDEIMNDFEVRISELFNDRIRLGYEVITIEHVDEVIKRMGKPEDLFGGEEGKDGNVTDRPDDTAPKEKASDGRKKLMRDPDNRILGGVAGGIAAYMGWDVTAVRLAMIVLLVVPYAPIVILYLILWLVMPQAQTAADRLIMRGKSVTLENIGKTVTDGFEKVTDNINDYVNSGKPKGILRKVADLFVAVVGFILKFLIILFGICLLPFFLLGLFLLVVMTVVFMTGSIGIFHNFVPFDTMFAGIPSPFMVMGSLALLFAVGIPVFALIYTVCIRLFHVSPLPGVAKWILLVLWVVAVLFCCVYFCQVSAPPIRVFQSMFP